MSTRTGELQYKKDADNSTTCSGAVKALFKLVCDKRSDCEIEKEYRNHCVSSEPDKKTEKQCVTVVDDYVERCFGQGTEIREGIIGGLLTNSSPQEAFCSGAGFVVDNGNSLVPVMVTVDHCKGFVKGDTTSIQDWIRRDRNVALVSHRVSVRRARPCGVRLRRIGRYRACSSRAATGRCGCLGARGCGGAPR